MNTILIIGSAIDSLRIKSWDLSKFSKIVVINNAWKIIKNWDYLIYPEDFPNQRKPSKKSLGKKKIITAKDYVPKQNYFGGFVYAGGTMAFTAGYWALKSLKPDVIAYIGCDMVYPEQKKNQSHFYGIGKADPLRKDITLQSLEAKSVRFMSFAQTYNCSVINLSEQTKSRLLFPRIKIDQFYSQKTLLNQIKNNKIKFNLKTVNKALKIEKKLDYIVPSGRYWEEENKFDKLKLKAIDNIWLKVPYQYL